MYDDTMRNLLAAVWYQALKDFKRIRIMNI